METVLAIVASNVAGGGGGVPGSLLQSSQQPVRVVVRSESSNDSLSEHEKRERAAVQSDVTELERDPAGMQSLGELVALAESTGVDSDRKKLSKKVVQLQGAQLRLIHSSTEVSSMTVEASPSLTGPRIGSCGRFARFVRSSCSKFGCCI
eukprot:754463-Prymnesium_polylepis.1